MLMLLEAWMCLCAFTLGALTLMGLVTPTVLLVMTFALGMGAAMDAPAWQATTPEVVPKPELTAAVALSSVAINIARAVGSALGGLIIVAPGYADPIQFQSGNPYGVSFKSDNGQTRPDETALNAARFQGRRVAEIAALFAGARAQ